MFDNWSDVYKPCAYFSCPAGKYREETGRKGCGMEDAVTLLASLSRNLDVFRSRLNAPVNEDVIVRRFISGAF